MDPVPTAVKVRTERTVVPVPGGHAPARLLTPGPGRHPVVVIGPRLDNVASPRAFADAGFVVVHLDAGPRGSRAWWEALAAFARRQPEADQARLVLAAGADSVHVVRDLVPTLDPAALLLAPSWRPRPLATALRRARTILEPDAGGVTADELTCPVVVPRDRPVPRWLDGTDLHRVHAEQVPTTVADLVAR